MSWGFDAVPGAVPVSRRSVLRNRHLRNDRRRYGERPVWAGGEHRSPPDPASGGGWDDRVNNICWLRGSGRPVQLMVSALFRLAKQRTIADSADIEVQLSNVQGGRPVVTLLCKARDEAVAALTALATVDP